MRHEYPHLGAFAPNDHPDKPAMFRWPSGLHSTDGRNVAGPYPDRIAADLGITMLLLARRHRHVGLLSRVLYALCAMIFVLLLLAAK